MSDGGARADAGAVGAGADGFGADGFGSAVGAMDAASAALRTRQLASLTEPGRRGALLVVDVQRSFADPDFLPWVDAAGLDSVAETVQNVAELVDQARGAGVPVVWVGLGQTAEHPWVSSLWLRGIDPAAAWPVPDEPCVLGTPGAEWFGMAPATGELEVAKRGYSGFFGTTLETSLRELAVDWVTVVGLTVDCCVDATARDAFQAGLPVLVPRDATTAYTAELAAHSFENIALNSGVIVSSAEVVELWGRAADITKV